MSIVLDGSVVLAWSFRDEGTRQVDDVMRLVGSEGAVVPAIWRLEVANALRSGIRRDRMTVERRTDILFALDEMDIATDRDTDVHAWHETLRLSDLHQLSTYDASYLDLALRLRYPLATLDKALRAAAEDLAVPLLGL